MIITKQSEEIAELIESGSIPPSQHKIIGDLSLETVLKAHSILKNNQTQGHKLIMKTHKPMKKIPRRIVTGIKDGKSIIIEDQQVENTVEHFPGLIISDIWNTQNSPATLILKPKFPIQVFHKLLKTEPISDM
jgi:hypothetical protein